MKYLLILAFLATSLSAQSATTKNYGAGCGGNFASMDAPILGQNVGVGVQNNNATTCAVGISPASANIPLPQSGCTMLVNPVWAFVFPSLGGNGTLRLGTIPNNTNLIGTKFYLQVTCNDSPGPSWSQGIEATIGR